MSDYTSTRRVSPRRRTTNLVAGTAFAGFAVFLVLLFVVEAIIDEPAGAGRTFEVMAAGSAMLAYVVGVLALAVGAIAFPSRGYWSPRDNDLPEWGKISRRMARVGVRVFWVSFGSALLMIVPKQIEAYVDVLPTSSAGDVAGGIGSAIAAFAMLLIVLGVLPWIVAEAVTGYRERAR